MNVSRLMFAASLLLVMGSAHAQLAVNSPFLPPPSSAAAAPAEPAPIQLKGIMAMGKEMGFLIVDTLHRKSMWVGLNEKGYDFLITKQDLARESVTVEQAGRTFTLTLPEAKVASSGQVGPPQMTVGGAPSGPNLVTQNVVLNPTPADDARRLDDVTAEIKKRRLARDQASAEAAGQPAAAQPQTAVGTRTPGTPPPTPTR